MAVSMNPMEMDMIITWTVEIITEKGLMEKWKVMGPTMVHGKVAEEEVDLDRAEEVTSMEDAIVLEGEVEDTGAVEVAMDDLAVEEAGFKRNAAPDSIAQLDYIDYIT
jgi:ribosomal protein L18E